MNLYQPAASGPLREVTQKGVQVVLAACLVRLKGSAPLQKQRRVAPAS